MDPPIVHGNDAIARSGESKIMRSHQQSYSLAAGKIQQQVKDDGCSLLIEGPGWLIGK
jgi:hypothetical protein